MTITTLAGLTLLIIAAYLLGSLSGSLLLGRVYRLDIRQSGSGNAGGTNALRARGWRFALPVVIVLILIVGMVSAVVLQRQASSRLVTERRLLWYREHHARAGLEEVLDAWLRSLPRNLRLEEVVGPTGEAMTIDLKDGSEAVISIRDGQGALLVEPAAVAADDRIRVTDAAQRFDDLVGPGSRPLERRRVGPLKLSLQAASVEAIEALASAYAPRSAAAEFATAIAVARGVAADGVLTNADLSAALAASGMESREAQFVRAATTLQPTLYFVTVEVRPRSRMRQRDAGASIFFGGYIPVRGGQPPVSGSLLDQRSGFLSFDRVSIE